MNVREFAAYKGRNHKTAHRAKEGRVRKGQRGSQGKGESARCSGDAVDHEEEEKLWGKGSECSRVPFKDEEGGLLVKRSSKLNYLRWWESVCPTGKGIARHRASEKPQTWGGK